MEALLILSTVILITLGFYSEYIEKPYCTAIGELIKAMLEKIRKKEETQLPTGIGYDENGYFIAYRAQQEFNELNDVFEGLYLSEHRYDDARFFYSFKFVRKNTEMNGSELYEYVDKKVASIVNRYTARMSGVRAISNISAVVVLDDVVMIYIARNQGGIIQNRNLTEQQYVVCKNIENEKYKENGSINNRWNDL